MWVLVLANKFEQVLLQCCFKNYPGTSDKKMTQIFSHSKLLNILKNSASNFVEDKSVVLVFGPYDACERILSCKTKRWEK